MPEAAGWTADLLVAGSVPLPDGALAPEGVLGPVEVVSNVLLLRGHGSTVLVDTAAGALAGGWEGTRTDLHAALGAAGCDPADVDALVLTHLDFDHCGDIDALPRARVLASEQALAAVAELPESAALIAAAGERVEAADDEPFPGIRLVAAPGHRAGHRVVDVGGELVFLADVVHHTAHLAHPEWDRRYDADPETAIATRREWIARLEGSGVLCAASHIAGWGRVVRGEDGAPAWSPA
jgi:glyoxylase-like metal-dependent hydrolase (beta-lactamase superfamily II)